MISRVNVLENWKEPTKEGFLDFFRCAVSCGALDGSAAGNSEGELAGQSVGELDGMLGNQPSSAKSSKPGELDGLSLGPQSTRLLEWKKTWGFGWTITRGIGR